MAPFSFIASAILSLAGAFTLQTTERLFNDKFALRPDQNGHCHLRLVCFFFSIFVHFCPPHGILTSGTKIKYRKTHSLSVARTSPYSFRYWYRC
ncbi:hypothetical protein L218DRAFT_962898, partial [Marasmius fiardii PR-910]